MRLKVWYFLALLVYACSSAVLGSADVPSVLSLEITERGSQTVLVIEVRHAQSTTTHYIDIIEVQVGDSTLTIDDLQPQTDTVFTVERILEASSDTIRARAHCTLHSWGQWRQLANGDGGESPGGIPGSPLASIIIAILGISIALRRWRPHDAVSADPVDGELDCVRDS